MGYGPFLVPMGCVVMWIQISMLWEAGSHWLTKAGYVSHFLRLYVQHTNNSIHPRDYKDFMRNDMPGCPLIVGTEMITSKAKPSHDLQPFNSHNLASRALLGYLPCSIYFAHQALSSLAGFMPITPLHWNVFLYTFLQFVLFTFLVVLFWVLLCFVLVCLLFVKDFYFSSSGTFFSEHTYVSS